jgi:hypothetical protein
MQPEFRTAELDFGRFDQMGMTDPDTDKWAFQRLLPEMEKFPEDWKCRRHIIILPDKRLDEMRVVRKSVQNFGRCQSVAGQLPNKVRINLRFSRHLSFPLSGKGALPQVDRFAYFTPAAFNRSFLLLSGSARRTGELPRRQGRAPCRIGRPKANRRNSRR